MNYEAMSDMDIMNLILDDNTSEEELFNVLSYKKYSILVWIRHAADREKYDKLYSSARFISALLHVYMDSPKPPVDDERVNVCGFLYDALVFAKSTEYTKKLVYLFIEAIAKDEIDELDKLQILDRNLCSFLVIAKYSTFNYLLEIRRINFALCTSYYKLFTPHELMRIYSVLCNKNFMDTFTASMKNMLLVYARKKKEKWVTDLAIQNDAVLDLAICMILESLEPADISRCLWAYWEAYRVKEAGKSVRQIVTNNPSYFVKIPIIMDELKSKGIYIP